MASFAMTKPGEDNAPGPAFQKKEGSFSCTFSFFHLNRSSIDCVRQTDEDLLLIEEHPAFPNLVEPVHFLELGIEGIPQLQLRYT